MLHEKPVQHGPPGFHEDGTSRPWTGEKRRRKCLPPSSSDSPTTAQDHPDLISHDATDMEDIIQRGQDHKLWVPGEDERWGPEVDISEEDAISYIERLAPDDPDDLYPRCMMTYAEFEDVRERIARYRIAYYKKVAKPESARELKGPEKYSRDELWKEKYFEHLEDDESFEGYFLREHSMLHDLDDYQRLVVSYTAHGSPGSKFLFWEDYCARYHTYDMDDVYVKYYQELSKRIKWLEGYWNFNGKSEEWEKMNVRAWRQALKIALSFPKMTLRLVSFAFDEYIWELKSDVSAKDLDLVYFEIWRLVAKQNRSFKKALEEVYAMDKFHSQKHRMAAELEGALFIWSMEDMTEEHEARTLFRNIVYKHKHMNMAEYARQKMEIAALMGLAPRFQDQE
ncbi:hypothetical protein BRADI_1g13380v3 [Brachypodium distachyon]|uniref:Uncharacterized protein n=1 Tax=Brachypodium distachyon TaxID=15368 RepID=A0A2K2DJA2_BRADI|nr:hypothetical protein BRADI_1g13380v3 [Brachypodium distachyon]